MNVLVTGAAGFIGFYVAKALIDRGDNVISVDNFNPYYDVNLKVARFSQIKDKTKLYEIDIVHKEKLKKVFEENKIDVVCHLAAQAGVRHSLKYPFEYIRTNIKGTLNIFELMKEFRIKNIIYASSSSVYGMNKKVPFSEQDNVDKPTSSYAVTKRSNELMAYQYHHIYGFNCTGLRFFTVYGPWGRPDMAYYKFTEAILSGKPIDVFNNGNMERDFTYITDVVSGALSAIDNCYPFEIFNLGNSNCVKLTYFIECIEKELGMKAEKNLLPMQPEDVQFTYADIRKAEKMLGYDPRVGIEKGIQEFIRWYRKYKGK